jgi:ribosomal protein S18
MSKKRPGQKACPIDRFWVAVLAYGKRPNLLRKFFSPRREVRHLLLRYAYINPKRITALYNLKKKEKLRVSHHIFDIENWET